MIFWLGVHVPRWLERTNVPLFISARRLRTIRRLPRAIGPWCLDSGGFSELSLLGRWETPAKQYVAETRMWMDEIGKMKWAAIQDWMCEPFILEKTGKTIADHQARTIRSLIDLRSLAPEIPWVPVLQGFHAGDYMRHVDKYESAGFKLEDERLVGVGSICRRQGTKEVESILRSLAAIGLKLHAFGAKTVGLRRYHSILASSDSMAWSFAARRDEPLPGHTHKTCANCLDYALLWRDRLLASLKTPRQLSLW